MLKASEMRLVSIISLKENKDSIMKRVQELGIAEVIESREEISKELLKDLDEEKPPHYLKEIVSLIIKIERVLDTFDARVGVEKSSIFPSQKKVIVEKATVDQIVKNSRELLDSISEVNVLESKISEIEIEIDSISEKKERLLKIADIDVDLRALGDGEFVYSSVFVLDTEKGREVEEKIKKITEYAYIFRRDAEQETVLVISVIKDKKEDVIKVLRESGAKELEFEDIRGIPKDAIEELERRSKKLEKEKKECIKKLKGFRDAYYTQLEVASELLSIERARFERYADMKGTDSCFTINLWVRKKDVNRLKKELHKISPAIYICEKNADAFAEKDVPTSLENPTILKPFEMLIEMFGIPRYKEIDPTLLFVPTFIIFFSLMLTDAIYGIMLLIFGCIVISKIKERSGLRDLAVILALAGLGTVITGMLTGGYMGDFFSKYLHLSICLLYTSPSPRDLSTSRMPSSA